MNFKKLIPLIIGVALLLLFLLMAICPQIFTPYHPKTDMFDVWQKPNSQHILGTNDMGYDIFTELVYGTRQTLLVGFASSLIALAIGAIVGMLSATKGIVGMFFSGLINLFSMLPRLIILIILSVMLGSSTLNLIVLISVFGWSGIARAVQAQVRHLGGMTFLENCVISGYGKGRILFFHILPNLKDILVSRYLLSITSCIMMESTLSFLGIGDLYNPTWGTMIYFAYKRGAFLRGAYNYLFAPAVCIMLVSFAVYLISVFAESKGKTVNKNFGGLV